jgi:hypothetical protein
VNCENRKAINIIYFVGKLLKALNGINNWGSAAKGMLKNHFDPNYPLFPHFARFLHG